MSSLDRLIYSVAVGWAGTIAAVAVAVAIAVLW